MHYYSRVKLSDYMNQFCTCILKYGIYLYMCEKLILHRSYERCYAMRNCASMYVCISRMSSEQTAGPLDLEAPIFAHICKPTNKLVCQF